MPIYRLNEKLWFPPPKEFEEDGIVAIGGDVSPGRLLLAYSQGIFPWYDEDPIRWWSPLDRMIVKPGEVKISRSNRNLINRNLFEFKADTCFEEVITHCQQIKRKGQDGTWLNDDLKKSLIEIHKEGYAHSIEAYKNGKLVGGLYGISLGKMFFGDSMFSLVSNASKLAFIELSRVLDVLNFSLIDCQVHTEHMHSLGAYEIKRPRFLELIQRNDLSETLKGSWTQYFEKDNL